MRFPFGIESAENLFLLGMSAMLTLDPSCETYRRPYLRAHSRRLRSFFSPSLQHSPNRRLEPSARLYAAPLAGIKRRGPVLFSQITSLVQHSTSDALMLFLLRR